MTTATNATLGRRKLRATLKRAREANGHTQEQVARAMDWSLSKLIRIESGAVGVSTTDLRALLQYYQIEDPTQVQSLVEMARASRKKPWWFAYRESLDVGYTTFLGLESGASSMRSFQSIAIPGLLQTQSYATEVSAEAWIGDPLPDQTVQEWVTVRMIRQQKVLERADPPSLLCVIDEAVLRRVVGGPDVMRVQLEHLIELLKRPNIAIRVVPFAAGVPLNLSSFVIFGFPDPEDADVVYLEVPRDQVFIEDQAQMEQYRAAFDRLLDHKAMSADDSLALIKQVADELR